MRRWQKGFTLVELLVVLAITGVIIAPLMLATITLLTNPQRTTDRSIVLQQIQNAGRWISRDIQMSGNVSATAPRGFPLTITIPVDDNPANSYTIDYVFDGNKLIRREYNSTHTLIGETLVSQYVDTNNTAFSPIATGIYKLSIKTVKDKAVVSTVYEIKQRLASF